MRCVIVQTMPAPLSRYANHMRVRIEFGTAIHKAPAALAGSASLQVAKLAPRPPLAHHLWAAQTQCAGLLRKRNATHFPASAFSHSCAISVHIRRREKSRVARCCSAAALQRAGTLRGDSTAACAAACRHTGLGYDTRCLQGSSAAEWESMVTSGNPDNPSRQGGQHFCTAQLIT